jgi:hypothetical protein
MAEKEKRILIDVINTGINCVYRLDNDPKGQSLCKHNGNMEPVTARECRHCDEGMSRQEAIERMTVAMCKFDCTDIERECENCNEWEKYDKCESLAEAALNALLEVK